MTASTDPISEEVYYDHPLAFGARMSPEDKPSLHNILHSPKLEHSHWYKAMYNKLDKLQDKGTYEIVDHSKAIKLGKQIVKST